MCRYCCQCHVSVLMKRGQKGTRGRQAQRADADCSKLCNQRTSQRPFCHSSIACFSETAGSLMWNAEARVRPTCKVVGGMWLSEQGHGREGHKQLWSAMRQHDSSMESSNTPGYLFAPSCAALCPWQDPRSPPAEAALALQHRPTSRLPAPSRSAMREALLGY